MKRKRPVLKTYEDKVISLRILFEVIIRLKYGADTARRKQTLQMQKDILNKVKELEI